MRRWLVLLSVSLLLAGCGMVLNEVGQVATLADLQERMKKAQTEIEDLKREQEFAAQAGASLRKFEVLNAKFYWRKERYSSDPVLALTVRNNTNTAISRAFFRGRVMSTGRSVPWVDQSFNYVIPGGVEPGETQTWELVPNSYGPWGEAPQDRDDLALVVDVVKLEGANGETLHDAEFPAYKVERLVQLEKELADLDAQVKKLTEGKQ